MTLELVAIIAFGIIIFEVGYFVGRRIGFSDGTLQIDTHSGDRDIYRFDIKIPIDELPKKKHIWIKVDHDADLFLR